MQISQMFKDGKAKQEHYSMFSVVWTNSLFAPTPVLEREATLILPWSTDGT